MFSDKILSLLNRLFWLKPHFNANISPKNVPSDRYFLIFWAIFSYISLIFVRSFWLKDVKPQLNGDEAVEFFVLNRDIYSE